MQTAKGAKHQEKKEDQPHLTKWSQISSGLADQPAAFFASLAFLAVVSAPPTWTK